MKYLLSVLLLSVGLNLDIALAVTTAGDPPSGTLSTDPDVTYYGVNMNNMHVSATNLTDSDCRDGTATPDSIESTSAGVQFDISSGAITANGSDHVAGFPSSNGDVTLTLKVKDKGDIFQDFSDFTSVATKVIHLHTPTTVTQASTTALNVPDAVGGQCHMEIKDEAGGDFTVSSVHVNETVSGNQTWKADGQFYSSSTIGGTATNTYFTNTDASGHFSDPVVTSIQAAIALAEQANAAHAISKFEGYIGIPAHSYSVTLGSSLYPLTNNYGQTQHLILNKVNGAWVYDSTNSTWNSVLN